MIRSTKHILKYQTDYKTEQLDKLFADYKEDLQFYIDLIWSKSLPLKNNLSSKLLATNKISHSQWKQVIYKQASEIIRSNIKKKKTSKPDIKTCNINIDERLFDIEYQDINSGEFNEFIKLRLPYFYKKKTRNCLISINLPIKYHKHFFKYKDWQRKKTIKLLKQSGKYFIGLVFEKDNVPLKTSGTSLGVDIGYKKLLVTSNGQIIGKDLETTYNKIANKKRGSKNYKQSLLQRDNELNMYVNQLDLSNVKELVIEDLKNVKHKSKLSRKFNNKLQYWSYLKGINKLEKICEENGILLTKVPPAYTSQTCSKCGAVDKKSRIGEKFLCTTCNYEIDADLNASVNILHRGTYSSSTTKNKSIENFQ